MPQTPKTKADAVRLALDAGMAKPQRAVEWIVKTFGKEMEMTPQNFSAVKSQLAAAADPDPVPPAPKPAPNDFGVVVKALHLMARLHGLEAVRDIATLAYATDRATLEEAVRLLTEAADTGRSGTPTGPR